MFPLQKSPTEQITDLVVFAGNLRVACELCARVERTEEIAGMHKIFECQMVSALRTAAEMISDLESVERSGGNNQNNEPSPAH